MVESQVPSRPFPSLDRVAYQGHAQRQILRALQRDRLPQAYLFHGPDGVGKEMFATGLAQLLLCETPRETALDNEQAAVIGVDTLRTGCGQCEDCRTVARDTHPDLHVIYRQLNRDHPDPDVRKRKALGLSIDVVRHFVIDCVRVTPVRGRAKVFIIREADLMTVQAQNALLKTLEEPPGPTFLMLLVTGLDQLLPTVLSRCQVVRFDTLPTAFVEAKLAETRRDLPEAQRAWYARRADGSAGAALQLVEDEAYELGGRLAEGFTLVGDRREASLPLDAKAWIDESSELGKRYRKRDPEISDTEAGRRALKVMFQLASAWFADQLRAGAGAATTVEWSGAPTLETMAAKTGIEAVRRLALAEHQLDLNANTQLCVEALINDLAHLVADRHASGRSPASVRR